MPEELAFLGLDELLERGYRLLSSGESRKLLLARALLQKPDFLLVEEPYDSLDQGSRRKLTAFFRDILASGRTRLLFLFSTRTDISDWHSHVAVLEKGELLLQGTREAVLANTALQSLLTFDAGKLPPWPPVLNDEPIPDIIVSLRKGRVSYGESVIFSDLDLQIRRGEHTLVTGPNGSGKSTLLSLISGDHPQSYGNDLQILSCQRGSGESIWELKRRIGIVSPELHRNHRVPGSALAIVLSGFFDSIGLYEDVSSLQLEHARHWLQLIGMAERADNAFRHLSYGEQRLVLIARALVKQPALLLCDEPSQGIDDINRHRFLYFLEHLAGQTQTTIIMASHRSDEQLDIFRHHLAL